MFKKTLLVVVVLTSCLFVVSYTNATTDVTSVSGTNTDGALLTIIGNSFGTAPTVHKWDDFEGDTHVVGNTIGSGPVGQIGWTLYRSDLTIDPRIRNENNRGGSTQFVRCDLGTGYASTSVFEWIGTTDMPEAYISMYLRWDRVSGNEERNEKFWRIAHSSWGGHIRPYVRYISNVDVEIVLEKQDSDSSPDMSRTYYRTRQVEAEWIRLEVYFKESTNQGTNGAIIWNQQQSENATFVNKVNDTACMTRDTDNHWKTFIFENYLACSASPCYYQHDFDDIYIASSRARVEIGDNATWSNCTHREIQIPTAWSDTSITITVNQGSFSEGETAYLFVVDADGNVNTNGYPITIGSGEKGDDITPPGDVTDLTIQAGDGLVALEWTNPTDSDFKGTMIRYRTDGIYPANNSDGIEVCNKTTPPGASDTYTLTGLSNGTTYYFSAFTYDQDGNYSKAAHISATPSEADSDTTSPGYVTNFAAQTGDSQVVLNWTNPSDSDFKGTLIRYRTDGTYPANNSDGVEVCNKTTPLGASDTYTLTGLSNGTTYYFSAFTYDQDGNYSKAAHISATPYANVYTKIFGDISGADFPQTCKDTYLNVGESGVVNYSSNSESIRTYTWPTNSAANRIVMKWDLLAVPQDAVVQEATLSLYMYGSEGTGGDDNYEITAHKILNHNPDILSCTWNTYDGANSWTGGANGGEQDIASAESSAIVDKTFGYKNWNITQMVQEWVGNSSTNLGLMLNSDTTAASDSNRYFRPTEYSSQDQRPVLTIKYGSADIPKVPSAPSGLGVSVSE